MKKKNKIIIAVSLFFLIIVSTPFLLLFTPPGNALISPFIEEKINSMIPVDIALTEFRLTPSHIYAKAVAADESYITADGTYGMFDKSFDIDYSLHVEDLVHFPEITKHNLQGRLDTAGNIKGDPENIIIYGKSDIAASDTVYDVTIEKSKIKKVEAQIKELNISKLLFMLKKPMVLDGVLDADINFDGLTPDNLKGNLTAHITNGTVNNGEMERLFDIKLPDEKIKLFAADINLNGDSVKYKLELLADPASVLSEGSFNQKSTRIDCSYKFDIKELAVFAAIMDKHYRGPLKLSGSAKGTLDEFIVAGKSNIAESNTTYKVSILNKKPQSAEFAIKNAKVAKLLYMLDKPIYSDATLNVGGNLTSLLPGKITGKIDTLITEGQTVPEVMQKQLNLKNANIAYDGKIDTVITDSVATSTVDMKSDIANLTSEKLIYNLNNNFLTTDFLLDIPDLDKLYFATGKHLKGDIKIIGTVKKDENLMVNAHADTLGGKVDIKLVNDKLFNHFEKIKTSQLLDMLMYPVVFESPLTGDVAYNLKTKKGTFKAILSDGRFMKNSLTEVVAKTVKFDLTDEVYKTTSIDAKIADKIITGNLNMKNGHSEISATSAIIDMARNTMDMKLHIKAKDNPVTIVLKGDIKKPHISLKTKELIKSKLGKLIEDKAPKKMKKLLQGVLDSF